MSSYVRPPIEATVVRDRAGHVVDFGNRWAGSPPEDSYSADAYPERFAPLHTVADALVAYLQETYDVDLVEGHETAEVLVHPASDVVRSVQVRPKAPGCAALTFVYTDYPGLRLHAGVLHDFPHPVCGCEACDSSWETEAAMLEEEVLAVAAGGYRESVERGVRPWVEYAFTTPDGGSSGRSRADAFPPERLRTAKPTLRALAGGWAAWPLIAPAPSSGGPGV